jgi:hypothetical protein
MPESFLHMDEDRDDPDDHVVQYLHQIQKKKNHTKHRHFFVVVQTAAFTLVPHTYSGNIMAFPSVAFLKVANEKKKTQ